MEGNKERLRKVGIALGIFVTWVTATYFLEGMRLTLNRPEAVLDRLIYTLVANVLIGIVLVFLVLPGVLGNTSPRVLGFRRLSSTITGVLLAVIAGAIIMVVAGVPTGEPMVLLNVYAQVLTVTIAEVLVCWVLVGGTVAAVAGSSGRRAGILAGIVSASVLFGIYHLAHSPPFNQPGMVLFLTGIGVITSLIYFGGREIYTTITFHNFFGMIGVLAALGGSGLLAAYTSPQYPLLILALLSLIVLVVADWLVIRRGGTAPESPG